MFFNDLYAIFVYLICAFVVSYVAFGISFFFGVRNADSNKVVAYECGFTPFEDANSLILAHFGGKVNQAHQIAPLFYKKVSLEKAFRKGTLFLVLYYTCPDPTKRKDRRVAVFSFIFQKPLNILL